jgi:EAL domain-containing protein (putative c-di-GMP-specific phosphodiesterase class I)
MRLIKSLRNHGCKVALDDFGTGMSSFSYLKSLEVDFIKIDGSFVRSMMEDEIDSSIVEAVNNIGHIAGIQTIAEFVENEAILQKLTTLGVDFAQGWAIERPQPFSKLATAQQATGSL